MAFIPKVWLDNDPTTPWSAAAAIDLETRLSNYSDTLFASVTLTGLGAAAALVQTAIKTANATLAANEFGSWDATSATMTATLPTAPPTGTRCGAKMVLTSAGHVVNVVTGGTDVINRTGGGTTRTLTLLGESVILQYAAGIWTVQASDTPVPQLDLRYASLAAANTITAAGAVPLTLIGGGSGNPVQAWRDSGTGKTLASITNISPLGYAGSQNFYGTNCIGGADASGGFLGWQVAVDQAAPTPDRDIVIPVKVRSTPAVGVVTTNGSTAITAPSGTFDVLNDPGMFISSANIPSQLIAAVADSSHATLTTGSGVTAGTATATISGARDLLYWFHNGKGYSQVGFFPRSYATTTSTLADGVVTGGTSLASATAAFTAANVGQTITVAGVANRVATFVDATHITLANATANASGVTFTYFTSVLAPSNAISHWGGPYGNANDPQQIELIPGVSQAAPVLGIRRVNEAQPVMSWSLSGGASAALLAPCMALGTGGGTWAGGGGSVPNLFVGASAPGLAWTVQRLQAPVGIVAGAGLPLSTVSATTSIPVSGGLNQALANGATIYTTYGGFSQSWVVNGAVSQGATAITVNSQTAIYPFPTGTQIVTANQSRIATLQNPYASDGGAVELGFAADTFTYATITASNPTHSNGEGVLTIRVGSGGAVGSLAQPGLVIGKNGVAFNGVAVPPAPNAAAAAATATAAAVATTASTNTAPYGFTTAAQADAIVAALNAIINSDLLALRTTANNARAILRSVGLAL